MEQFLKRTWAEIDLDALHHNYHAIASAVANNAEICWVVKADGYGHGAVVVSRTLEKLGARWFAVSNLEEAMQLRNGGIRGNLLILGYTPPTKAKELSKLGISQAVFSLEYARELSACAVVSGVTVNIHIKVDTGMNRIGFLYQDTMRDASSLDEMEQVCHLSGLFPEGIFTHFAVADEGKAGEDYTRQQFSAFLSATQALEERGITFRYRHAANSGAVCDYPEMHLDMVRPGILIYGLLPSQSLQHPLSLKPMMALKTVISLLKTVEENASVSYGRVFTTPKTTRLATVPIGYADGYPRRLHQNGYMLVHGKKAPICGRVCMDQLMLDVTDIPEVKPEDIVTVFGQDGKEILSVDALAEAGDTINYEMVCIVGKRVPRVFLRYGKVVGSLNYICPTD